jgi:hypothetical protein
LVCRYGRKPNRDRAMEIYKKIDPCRNRGRNQN